ncbi:MAG: NERD domain-containing protein [Chloroflexota bacterium]|nr:NERD domain-containing protein [Chloroflexota bacterium]
MPNTWTVIANKILAINATNSFEIDFIVIGPHRITILDEKSYRGRITGTDEIWTRSGGDSIPSPFGKIDMIARKLAGFLDRKVTGFPRQAIGRGSGGRWRHPQHRNRERPDS